MLYDAKGKEGQYRLDKKHLTSMIQGECAERWGGGVDRRGYQLPECLVSFQPSHLGDAVGQAERHSFCSFILLKEKKKFRIRMPKCRVH